MEVWPFERIWCRNEAINIYCSFAVVDTERRHLNLGGLLKILLDMTWKWKGGYAHNGKSPVFRSPRQATSMVNLCMVPQVRPGGVVLSVVVIAGLARCRASEEAQTCTLSFTTSSESFSEFSAGETGNLHYKLWAGDSQVGPYAASTFGSDMDDVITTTAAQYGPYWSKSSWGDLTSVDISIADVTSFATSEITMDTEADLTDISLFYAPGTNGWAMAALQVRPTSLAQLSVLS